MRCQGKGERRDKKKKRRYGQLQTIIINTIHVDLRERGRCRASNIVAKDKREKLFKPDLFFSKR
jgi:hypothetical protein